MDEPEQHLPEHERAPFTSLTLDPDGRILRVGPTFTAATEVPTTYVVGHRLTDFVAGERDLAELRAILASPERHGYARLTMRRPHDGELQHVVMAWTPGEGDELQVVLADETEALSRYFDLQDFARRVQVLAANSADVMWLMDDDGRVMFATSALAAKFGWQVDDVRGRPGVAFVHPDDVPLARETFDRVRRGERQLVYEIRLLRADGATVWTRATLTDLRHEPSVAGIMGSAVDIDDKKAEEARRAEDEAQYRARFEQSYIPQSVTDPSFRYQDVNAAYCTLLGRSREEFLGRRPDDFLHETDPGTGGRELASMADAGRSTHRVYRVFRHQDGSAVPVLVSGTALQNAAGELIGYAAVLEDQRALFASERRREETQRLFETIADRSDELLTVVTPNREILYSSPNGPRLANYHESGVIDEIGAFAHPDDAELVRQQWERITTTDVAMTFRFRAFLESGEQIWLEQTSTNLSDTPIGGVVTTMRDVTDEVESARALAESEARHRMIADLADEGIWVIAQDGRTLYANARLASLVGYTLEQLYAAPVWDYMDEEIARLTLPRLTEREVRGSERYEVAYRHPDGRVRRLRIAASPMRNADGVGEGSLAMVSDVTETRRIEGELWHAALHDALTGLPNRSLLMERIEDALDEKADVALLFVDLDLFKDVNDARGHGVGDQVLVAVAHRLASIAGPHDTVARFGGDEFAVLLHDANESHARALATRALEALQEPFDVGDVHIGIGGSIGIALSPAASPDDLLRYADTAMYAAKAAGRGRVQVFDAELEHRSRERYVLGADLRAALQDGGLQMAYQPVVDLADGRVVGVEALSRWDHPEHGPVPAQRFIDLAESLGLAPELDRWALDRSLGDVARMRERGVLPDDAYVAVNLSGRSLADETLDRYIIERTAHHGLDPRKVVLELTESAIMADPEVAIGLLDRLRTHCFPVAVDDFGTGYSSLAYLRDLPVTMLKIDRSFVAGVTDDQHSLAIVASVLQLARTLDLALVAEGVETEDHARVLREHGCRLAQGWLWSKAVTPEEAEQEGTFTRVQAPGGP
ncbi:bifunctional diguanylate cyclase/phosphodiesterase [Aeromicrobium massiliense]|uniref:bifunctional diguanylate cyclase/phosphodiesterase n=1 Tax=Aeromicrobium massiliense TaxID=1464554 RepID=UPI00030AE54A|nr:EAL domain-containing protein [Aeromicrobium massiliense]